MYLIINVRVYTVVFVVAVFSVIRVFQYTVVFVTLTLLTKESVVTQRCWSPRKIRKATKKSKFDSLKIHETKKAHTR